MIGSDIQQGVVILVIDLHDVSLSHGCSFVDNALVGKAKAAEMVARRAGRGAVPIQTMPNERALLSLFFQKLQQEDPDVLVAHNLMGFDFDILLSRAVYLKLATWSKVRCFFCCVLCI